MRKIEGKRGGTDTDMTKENEKKPKQIGKNRERGDEQNKKMREGKEQRKNIKMLI